MAKSPGPKNKGDVNNLRTPDRSGQSAQNISNELFTGEFSAPHDRHGMTETDHAGMLKLSAFELPVAHVDPAGDAALQDAHDAISASKPETTSNSSSSMPF